MGCGGSNLSGEHGLDRYVQDHARADTSGVDSVAEARPTRPLPSIEQLMNDPSLFDLREEDTALSDSDEERGMPLARHTDNAADAVRLSVGRASASVITSSSEHTYGGSTCYIDESEPPALAAPKSNALPKSRARQLPVFSGVPIVVAGSLESPTRVATSNEAPSNTGISSVSLRASQPSTIRIIGLESTVLDSETSLRPSIVSDPLLQVSETTSTAPAVTPADVAPTSLTALSTPAPAAVDVATAAALTVRAASPPASSAIAETASLPAATVIEEAAASAPDALTADTASASLLLVLPDLLDPATDAADPLFAAGFLLKRGYGIFAGYKQRWVVVKRGYMFYFDSDAARSKGSKPNNNNFIDLAMHKIHVLSNANTWQMRLEPTAPNAAAASSRVWELMLPPGAAVSDEARDRWVHSLQSQGAALAVEAGVVQSSPALAPAAPVAVQEAAGASVARIGPLELGTILPGTLFSSVSWRPVYAELNRRVLTCFESSEEQYRKGGASVVGEPIPLCSYSLLGATSTAIAVPAALKPDDGCALALVALGAAAQAVLLLLRAPDRASRDAWAASIVAAGAAQSP